MTRSLWINSESDETLRIRIYLGDWLIDAKGNEQFLEPDTVDHSLCRWVTVSPLILSIPPRSSRQVFYEISIPADEASEGSYWGMIFIEKEPPPVKRRKVEEGRSSVAIRAIVRYGLRLLLTVPGTEIREARFISSEAGLTEKGVEISALLRNNGNIYLRPHVWLELRDLSGMTVYSAEHRELTVLPKSKRDFTFELRELNLPPGRYTALIIADYDAPNLIAAQAEIEIKEK